jgi:hypothetical protein
LDVRGLLECLLLQAWCWLASALALEGILLGFGRFVEAVDVRRNRLHLFVRDVIEARMMIMVVA